MNRQILLIIGTFLMFWTSCKTNLQDGESCQKQSTEINYYTSDSVQIFGDLYIKDRSAKTIVLFHQAGANARGEYEPIIPELSNLGLNILAVDQRTGGQIFGSCNRTMAQIPLNRYGYCDAYPEMEGALSYLGTNGFSEDKIVWGSSYSAALVIKLAAEHSDEVAGVLAFSPASGDGGLTWENISDGLTPGTVVAFETIGDTLFVGLYTEDTFETLHMSTDFGDTWQLVESFTYGEIFALQAFDNNLIALTDPGGYVLSTDRGATWSQNVQGLGVDNDTGGAPKKFTKMGETLYATTAQGVAYSEDKGHNWTYPENNGLPEIQGNKVTSTIFTFADTLFAGAASLDNPGGLYFSTDKGTNWEYLSNDLQDLYPSSLIKLDSGYAISTVGSIGILESSGVYYSPDKGETWQNITEGLPRPPEILITDINAMAAHEGKLFVGVQSDGLYYYSTNPPETVTGIESSIDGEDFAAFNYPNPFTDYTTISFKTNKAGKVKITVYDMHGNLISQPVSNVYPSGLHSIKFNAEGLKDGVYFYRTELDGAVTRSGRMVLRR